MIRIITDSTCDIPRSKISELGIDIIPLSVFFEDKEYKDGVDLSPTQFYELLGKSTKLPTTSQVNPDTFSELFKKYTDAGDQVIGIFISSKISGTFQSAKIAREMVAPESIYLLDSKLATIGLAILVYEAVKLRDQGKPVQEIFETLSALPDRIAFLTLVGTLKYLKMGGRVSSAAAFIGGALGISPLVSMIDGEVQAVGKVRGKVQGREFFDNYIEESPIDTDYPLYVGHSDDVENGHEFMEYLNDKYSLVNTKCESIGCVIGTHGGPGCLGIVYVKKA